MPEAAPPRSDHPCAACRTLRRKCGRDCALAPYFPLEELENFTVVHRVFGASNVIKMIQEVEESMREDAVKSMVYEARARLQDPIYGSAGAIFHLQKHVQELLLQLQLTRARVIESQEQRDQLLSALRSSHPHPHHHHHDHHHHLLLDHPMASTVVDDNGTAIEMETTSDILLDDGTMGYNLIEVPVDCHWIL